MKIFQLVLVVMNISYFVGMMWMIICEIIEDFVLGIRFYDTETNAATALGDAYFIPAYGLERRPPSDSWIIVTYFAITSLSTVGFGDYNPKSNFERLLCSFVLVFGVATFSYTMGNFLIIVETAKRYYSLDKDEGDELTKFMETLRKFNYNQPIDLRLQQSIESYFAYRWEKDLNQALLEGDDLRMYKHLEDLTQ